MATGSKQRGSEISAVEALKILEGLIRKKPQTPEPGFYTIEQWCKKLNRKHVTMGVMMKAALEAKKVEKRMYLSPIGKKVAPLAHYRFVQ